MLRLLEIMLGAIVVAWIVTSCSRTILPEAKGHEETPRPVVVFPPKGTDLAQVAPPAGKPAEASREIGPQSVAAAECQTSGDAVDSVVSTAPDARVTQQLAGADASRFIARFNAATGADVAGDEVLIVDSRNFAAAAVAVFARDHCVVRTLAYRADELDHHHE
jgi:hypothetical protein